MRVGLQVAITAAPDHTRRMRDQHGTYDEDKSINTSHVVMCRLLPIEYVSRTGTADEAWHRQNRHAKF